MALSALEAVFLALAMLAYAVAAGVAGFDLARRRHDSRARTNPWISRGLLIVAFASHSTVIALRAGRLGDHALQGTGSTLIFVAFCATLVGIIIDIGQVLRSLTLFLCPPVMTALAVAAFELSSASANNAATIPANARLAVDVHVLTVIVAYGAFAFAAVLSVMYLYLEGQLKKKRLGVLFDLPALDRLERVEGRFVVSGFGLLTVSLAIGLATQQATGALGTAWLTKPTNFTALVTWGAAACLVVGRALSLLAGRRQVFATLAVFALVLVTYLGAPLLSGEPHVPGKPV
ncbi:MAG TPA: cytochrome c biogenesis protein CcsA [Planctomycetota bacterium]|nr:cytochrome c biogenesis protein CcsA [Planctomycetota bacterium]